MVLNQDLSRVVPSSELSEELLVKRSGLQQEISKIEEELAERPAVKTEGPPSGVKKVQDHDGQVRIWSSTSGQ